MEKTTFLSDTYTPILNKVKEYPTELARYYISKHHIYNQGSKEYIYENDEKIASAWCALKLTLGRKSFYTKMVNKAGMSYNKQTKKISVWGKGAIKDNFELFMRLAKYMKIDWFTQLSQYERYKNLPLKSMLTVTLGSHILSGKIKNPEELIKDYMCISHKRKDIPWKLVRDFLCKQEKDMKYYNITLYNVLTYATNPISALNKLTYTDCDKTYCETICDILTQCYILDKPINFLWSIKRLNEEHEKFTNQLMSYEMESKDNTPIEYIGELPMLKGMSILNTEYEAYREATYMHNCIYTNYWRRMLQRSYMVVKYVKEGVHYDIGIFLPTDEKHSFGRYYSKVDLSTPYIDQIRAIRNTEPPKEVIDEINEWFNSEEVFKFFTHQTLIQKVELVPSGINMDIAPFNIGDFDNEEIPF